MAASAGEQFIIRVSPRSGIRSTFKFFVLDVIAMPHPGLGMYPPLHSQSFSRTVFALWSLAGRESRVTLSFDFAMKLVPSTPEKPGPPPPQREV